MGATSCATGYNYNRIKVDVITIIEEEFEEKRDLPGFKELWEAKMKEEESGGNDDGEND
jgi:hypothetical protein